VAQHAGMPRGTDHAGMDMLSLAECLDHLRAETVGRVAFVQAGEPVVLPVNYLFYRDAIVFRTARGEKLEAAWRRSPVAFEIDGFRSISEDGWSVLVRGMAEVVDDETQLDELSSIPFKTWAKGSERPYWVKIHPDEITGRSI